MPHPLVYFTPPTYEAAINSPERILRFYRLTRARSIVRVGGVFTAIHAPDPDLLVGLVEGEDYFRGGYDYHIPKSLRDELDAAGFPSGRPPYGYYGGGAYGAGPYGGIA